MTSAVPPTKTELRVWISLVMTVFIAAVVLLFIGYAMWRGTVDVSIRGEINPQFFLGFLGGIASASILWLWERKGAAA